MKIDSTLVQAFQTEIERASKILIGTHLNPDGDALGSALGLALYLEAMGKKVEVLCHHDAPRNLRFLPTVKRVRQAPAESDYDLGIVVDLDAFERLGSTAPFFESLKRLIVIDHHVPHEAPGDLRIIEIGSAATALIITNILQAVDAEITPDMATCLYTGISTDTGSFRFRNTSPDALMASALLLENGANLELVSEEIFQNRPLSSARLLGHALETMKLDMDDRLAWSCLSNRDFEWAKATDEDTEGFVNELLSIETVQIAALIREVKPGKIRCSIRSRRGYDVAEVAREFGGGGHRNAAGCNFEGDLSDAEHQLIEGMRRCLASS
ncbi:MAG: bifunctional oligoribonuclease/PAP phosphatase NrnA [Armatimonadetes bacterium]|nr:bifunctional oligoribonuclease/PAP phosphatase NrnA [Armatimonadota bacterium]MBS1727220.1 bifunctional oligoribonuclease/PAP phosphatase NrnA [Armatimonadota bacterium]